MRLGASQFSREIQKSRNSGITFTNLTFFLRPWSSATLHSWRYTASHPLQVYCRTQRIMFSRSVKLKVCVLTSASGSNLSPEVHYQKLVALLIEQGLKFLLTADVLPEFCVLLPPALGHFPSAADLAASSGLACCRSDPLRPRSLARVRS